MVISINHHHHALMSCSKTRETRDARIRCEDTHGRETCEVESLCLSLSSSTQPHHHQQLTLDHNQSLPPDDCPRSVAFSTRATIALHNID
jgi:hypothetical protein